MKMYCLECKKLGLKSVVYEGCCRRTLMAPIVFYDEDGEYHRHDPNITTTSYQCSKGHVWQEDFKSTCGCGELDLNVTGICTIHDLPEINALIGKE